MSKNNLPWRYAHIKCSLGYRRWETIKYFNEKKHCQKLLDAHASGRNALLIHIPKTAGVSLIKTYEDYFSDARHSTALLYKWLLGSKYRDFNTVAIVRNPWARLFSAYNFLMQGGLIETDREMGMVLKTQCPTFEQFVKEWLPKYGACSYMHFVPQHEFTCGWGEAIIVDNIIKLENLNDEWPGIAVSLEMPVRNIQHVNVSRRENYRQYYDNESVEIVGKLYASDIKMFDYSYT